MFTVLYCSLPVAKSHAVVTEMARTVKTMRYRIGKQTYLDWKGRATK
jgi:hypothetical protein